MDDKFLKEMISVLIKKIKEVDINTLTEEERREYYNVLKQEAIMNFEDDTLDEAFEKDLNEEQNKQIISVLEQTTKILEDIMEGR